MNERLGHRSVYEAFLESARAHADKLFLKAPAAVTASCEPAALALTYRQAADAARHLAAGYRNRGVGAGQRVAVAFDSRLDTYLHLLALNALGAGIVPLNSTASDAELQYLVSHSDSVLIAAADELVERLRGVAGGRSVLQTAELSSDDAVETAPLGDRGSEAALLYTSGTTGKPKGCMLSNDYFLALGAWYNSLGGLCSLSRQDRLMTPLPPNHMNALATSFMAMMLCGGAVIQLDRFHPRSWWQTARDEQATVIHCLGVMVAMLLSLDEREDDDFSGRIKFCFGPGSDPRHQALFEQRFGIPLIEAWAMTETGAGGMTIADREPRHVGRRCIGRPAATMEYRLVDVEGRDVPGGEAGELLVRSRGSEPRRFFFSGYYKDEAATREAWRDGWFHTGDVVREGDDGSLYFVDRRKNVIRRSGENIAAVEVEASLLQCEEVANCAVCPVPDEIRGDEVFAFVVRGGAGSTDAELANRLFRHCRDQLAYYKAPGYFAFVDALPLTASQKVSRGQIKALATEALRRHAAIDLRHLKMRNRG